MGKSRNTLNARALSIYIGSALLPGRDGKAQRKLSAREAYEKAVEQDDRRKRG